MGNLDFSKFCGVNNSFSEYIDTFFVDINTCWKVIDIFSMDQHFFDNIDNLELAEGILQNAGTILRTLARILHESGTILLNLGGILQKRPLEISTHNITFKRVFSRLFPSKMVLLNKSERLLKFIR
ncbi:hypothetical protein [Neobacillus niacini]|uniref:hypothetical protein n=1 Tax=Neobacillus niacini TaxID=86668 RepID=UPI0021CB4BBF|nr:hypothetical protein [Neobacillus niacini]MCM3763407.1 hypothetical protein [Neobacillus niacini]